MSTGSPVTLEPLSEGKYRLALHLQGREITLSQRELNSLVFQGTAYVSGVVEDPPTEGGTAPPIIEQEQAAEDGPPTGDGYILDSKRGEV